MRSRLMDLPRKARALFQRGGIRRAVGCTVSSAIDYELLDESGQHLGTIKTSPAAPTFGKGAPTYLLTRLLRRARDLGARLGDQATLGVEEPESEEHTP